MKQAEYSSLNETFVLLHPPKTAGSSVAAGLGVANTHANLRLRRDLAGPVKWAKTVVAVTLRNPWDRSLSWFYYGPAHKKYMNDFEKWVLDGMPVEWKFDPSMEEKYQPRFHYQEDWFEEEGEIVFIIRFERLQKDWEKLLGVLGLGYRPLPHLIQRDRPRGDYREIWTPEMVKVAEPVFGYFAEKYEYTFGDEPAANSLLK